MHIEAMAVGIGKDEIITRLIAGAGPARAGDMVTTPADRGQKTDDRRQRTDERF